MTKVRHSVAHLVSHTHIIHVDNSFDRGDPLSETEWLNFCKLPSSEVSVGVCCVPSVTMCVCVCSVRLRGSSC